MIDGRVPQKPPDNNRRGRLQSVYQWLTGVETPAPESRGPRDETGQVPPTRIGHYVIERKLGEGGMGVVYAARDERLQRTVALKTMASLTDDETARQRFWREARAAASVNHPNICQIYEIGDDRGELFIAMELLEGECWPSACAAGRCGRPTRCRSASACSRPSPRCTAAPSSTGI